MEWFTDHLVSWLVVFGFVLFVALMLWAFNQKDKTAEDYRYLCHDEWWWHD